MRRSASKGKIGEARYEIVCYEDKCTLTVLDPDKVDEVLLDVSGKDGQDPLWYSPDQMVFGVYTYEFEGFEKLGVEPTWASSDWIEKFYLNYYDLVFRKVVDEAYRV